MNSFNLNIEQIVVKGYHSNQTHISRFISIISKHIVAKRYRKVKLLRQPKCLTLDNIKQLCIAFMYFNALDLGNICM